MSDRGANGKRASLASAKAIRENLSNSIAAQTFRCCSVSHLTTSAQISISLIESKFFEKIRFFFAHRSNSFVLKAFNQKSVKCIDLIAVNKI